MQGEKNPGELEEMSGKTQENYRDWETPNFERTPRRRPPHKKTEVECHVCGKTFKEDPKYVHGEYYRCNRCTGK